MGNKKSVYLNIDSEFLERKRQEMEKAAKDDFGSEDGKSRLVYAISEEQADAVNTRIEEIDADSNTITVVAETELGDVWLTAELTIDQLISLIEVATKKLNKAKTLLETIK